MRVSEVEYAVTLSADYNNYRCGVVVDLEPGDSELEAVARARAFVDQHVRRDIIPEWRLQTARQIVATPVNHTAETVADAQRLLDQIESDFTPF